MDNNIDPRTLQASTHARLCEAAMYLARAVECLSVTDSNMKKQELSRKKKRKKAKQEFDQYDVNTDNAGYRDKKLSTITLSEIFAGMGMDTKAQRTHDCGTLLQISHAGDKPKLKRTNSCRARLCPFCMWKLSRKVAFNLSRIMDYLIGNEGAEFIMLTLTQKNVSGAELGEEIDRIIQAWKRLTDTKPFRRAVDGHVRALEVTHDVNPYITEEMYNSHKRMAYYKKLGLRVGDENPAYNTYHPHLHIILHVKPSYFKHPDMYIAREAWATMWQRAMELEYLPVVDVRKFDQDKGHNKRGAFEISKYVIKPADFMYQDKEHLLDTVKTLDDALYKRVLVAYAGSFRKARTALNLQDDISGAADQEEYADDSKTSTWAWNFGYAQYKRL